MTIWRILLLPFAGHLWMQGSWQSTKHSQQFTDSIDLLFLFSILNSHHHQSLEIQLLVHSNFSHSIISISYTNPLIKPKLKPTNSAPPLSSLICCCCCFFSQNGNLYFGFVIHLISISFQIESVTESGAPSHLHLSSTFYYLLAITN